MMITGIEATRAGGQTKLADLYCSHAPGAIRLAFLMTGDQHAAEDVVQDAFVRLFGRFRDLRDPHAFETYLRRTVVNLSRDRFRRMRLERDRAAGAGGSESENGTRIEDRDVIRRALRSLPQRQRAALVLRFFVDLSERQTADVLDCSVPAVKSLVARATSSISERMKGEVR